jgi:hypothetical protein
MAFIHRQRGGGIAPEQFRVVDARLRARRAVLRLLGLALTLGLLLAGFAHSPSGRHVDPFLNPTVEAATLPSDGPCGSHHGAGHDHALCSLSASCSFCALLDTFVSPARNAGMKVVDNSDSPHRGNDAKPPFHPPKLLVTA